MLPGPSVAGRSNYCGAVVIPPIIVSAGPDCWFYQSGADALAVDLPDGAKLFDGTGQHLELVGGHIRVLQSDRDGTEELTAILADWLRDMDAIRWSIADWQLSMLLRCAIEHAGWSGTAS